MNLNDPLLMVAFVLAMVVVSFGVAWMLVRHAMGQLDRRFPPVSPADDAVRRRFQSFRFGIVNASFSIHVAADDQHVHLTPITLLRVMGFKPMSIPWGEIQVRSAGRFFTTATIAGVHVQGPTWCLRLADS